MKKSGANSYIGVSKEEAPKRKGAVKVRIEAKAGLRLLQNGILGIRLKYTAENVPVLLLSGLYGELRLDMDNIYQQAFTARLDGKA